MAIKGKYDKDLLLNKSKRYAVIWRHDALTCQDNQRIEITDIKQFDAEIVLRYRALLSQSTDGVIVFDYNTGNIIEFNSQLLYLLGYTEKELLNMKVDDLFDDERYHFQDNLSQVVQSKVIQKIKKIKCKDGTRIEIRMKLSLVDCNLKTYCLANVTDLTPQKRYEDAFKSSLSFTKRVLKGSINALIAVFEKRDSYTNVHQAQVAMLATSIAKEMGLKDSQIENIIVAGKLHDLGKIAIPSDILTKPGPLSAPEMEIIKCHPSIGREILEKIPLNYIITTIVAQHHERLNGNGYPCQLSGKDILPEARILAVADVVEAISSHRPYRPALGIEKALEELEVNSGILYDPPTVKACFTVLKNNHMDLAKILSEK